MKPWREITVPHRDVLEGTFQQSESAKLDYTTFAITQEADVPGSLEGALPEVKRKPFVADGGPKLILSGIAKTACIADDSCD